MKHTNCISSGFSQRSLSTSNTKLYPTHYLYFILWVINKRLQITHYLYLLKTKDYLYRLFQTNDTNNIF